MSLSAAINSARTAIHTSSLGIQIAGNNMANVATPGYSRQIAVLRALEGARGQRYLVGGGVGVAEVQRKVDEALLGRLRSGISQEHAAAQKVATFGQLESILNELTGFDLSTGLSDFFSVWSEATSLLESGAVVIEQGGKLAGQVRSLRGDVVRLREQIEQQLDQTTRAANDLLSEIAAINETITQTEIGPNKANALRDQRDQLVAELSTLIDVTTVEDGQGNLDIISGSTPLIIGSENRGIDIEREVSDGRLEVIIVAGTNRTPLPVTGGQIGGLLESRDGTLDRALSDLDDLAARLIFEVNKIHSTGSNDGGFGSLSSSLQVGTPDRTLAFNDPNNQAFAGLPFAAENGGFFVKVTNSTTGGTSTVRIDVDLDGLDATGAPGFGDDTTPEDVRAALDAVDGISATWAPDGTLEIDADTGYSFSFADDTSGALAVLGVNSFFEGTDGQSIAIRESLVDTPGLLALGRYEDDTFVANGTAMAIAGLQEVAIDELGGRSVGVYWGDAVQRIAVKSSSARTEADATALVRESLESQRYAASGVSLDEESINLIAYQQQYQSAARVIEIADQLMQELMNIL